MTVASGGAARAHGAAEPVREPLGGLFGGGAVERHQRGRPASAIGEVGTPSVVTDGPKLDSVRAAVDFFGNADNVHWRGMILVSQRQSASEAPCEAAPRLGDVMTLFGSTAKIFGRRQNVHSQSTIRPQFFHRSLSR